MDEKILYLELDLNASVQEVWRRWTTQSGIESFFAPACNLDIRPDGYYEIFFFPENPPGQRGADGQRVMAVEDGKLLSFTWNFPPQLADIREQRTIVILRFAESESGTKLTLSQVGFGTAPIWNEGFEYFRAAWGKVVLPRLKYAIENGPIDWSNPPDIAALCATK